MFTPVPLFQQLVREANGDPQALRAALLRSLLAALGRFGEIEILMPLAIVIVLWLFLRSRRAAAWWAAAVIFCVGLTATLKLGFYGCPPAPHLHNPSGHTSLSTLVYGAMALVTAAESRGLLRIIVVTGSAVLILVIAASRLLLNAHTAVDVGLGLAIGAGALAFFGRGYLRCRSTEISLWLLIATAAAVALLLYGRRLLDVDQVLRQIASYVHVHCL